MRSFLILFCTVIPLLLITACEEKKETTEIKLGEKFIKELYNIDDPSTNINDTNIEELIEFQNKFSSYFTEEEFNSLASIRFFLMPQEASSKQNSEISVEDISFIKSKDNQKKGKITDFDFTFTLILTNQSENKVDEIEVKGQISIIESNNELKISRYYDGDPLKDIIYKDTNNTN